MTLYTPYEGQVTYGIYDLESKEWTLDCFDYPRLWNDTALAEGYRVACLTYNSGRYEVREYETRFPPLAV